jgi:AP-3 complex subunit mu
MPKSVTNLNLIPSQGRYTFDPVAKLLHWDVGKVDLTKLPNIKGSISSSSSGGGGGGGGNNNSSSCEEPPPPVSVHFTINQMAVSGLKVSRLDMFGEKYRPFKGVKYITKGGKYQFRL